MRRRVLWVAALLLLLALGAARAGLPAVLAARVETLAAEWTGRHATLERLDLGLWAGRVALEGFALGGPLADASESEKDWLFHDSASAAYRLG